MRFPPAKLFALAEEVVARYRREVALLAAYLCGSLVTPEGPFLGEAADVDLVLVYNGTPSQPYTLTVVHPKVTVEVYAHERARYEPPRTLRTDPLWGPTLFHARPLYDPQHFLDFVQAAVRSRFRAPEVAWARAQRALAQAREAWRALDTAAHLPHAYLRWLYWATNVPAALVGEHLTPRRLPARFAALAHRLGQPAWVGDFYRLLGVAGLPSEALQEALAQALRTESLPEEEGARARWGYFLAAAQVYAQTDTPNQAWFPLVWAAARVLPQHPLAPWLWERLGWQQVAPLAEAADAWLDQLEAFLEAWAHAQGVA